MISSLASAFLITFTITFELFSERMRIPGRALPSAGGLETPAAAGSSVPLPTANSRAASRSCVP